MGYFPVRYDSRVIIYDCRGFIRLATAQKRKEIREKRVLRLKEVIKKKKAELFSLISLRL